MKKFFFDDKEKKNSINLKKDVQRRKNFAGETLAFEKPLLA